MRRLARALLVGLLAVSLGCRQRAGEEGHAHEEAALTTHDAAAPDTLLRIAPVMLRDLRITTAAVESRPMGESVTVLGELGVNEEAYAEVASPIRARVVQVLAGVGDAVAPGHPLAALESVELGRARADYLAARARARLAATTLERRRRLAGERIVPRREVQEAEATAAAADAELRAAAAALAALGVSREEPAAGDDVAGFVLRAPVAGVVIERSAVRGQLADPEHALFRVADLARPWLTVHAFERDAARIGAGAAAEVSFAALPGRSFPGTVALVGRQVEPSSRTVPVRIDVQNEEGSLRPGMSATARVTLGEGQGVVVAVPAASLQRLGEGWCVFLPAPDEGAFEIRPVGRGRDLGGEVEIVSGLTPGETVVVDGAFLLKAEAERSRGEGEHHAH